MDKQNVVCLYNGTLNLKDIKGDDNLIKAIKDNQNVFLAMNFDNYSDEIRKSQEIDDKFKEMKQNELDWEGRVLKANPEVFEVYEYVKNQGKKVVITSDMYLPTNFLGRVLENKGYKNFDKLYVSSQGANAVIVKRLF